MFTLYVCICIFKRAMARLLYCAGSDRVIVRCSFEWYAYGYIVVGLEFFPERSGNHRDWLVGLAPTPLSIVFVL